MNLEEEMATFVDTGVWMKCGMCGRTYGGLGVENVMVTVGDAVICLYCVQEIVSREVKKRMGNLC